MTGRLPPLYALKAFESASRVLSFTRAAEELHLTPAAISHQIKTLEERLGVQLFQRQNNKIMLTPKGQDFLPAVREALEILAAAAVQLRGCEEPNVVKLSVLPTFAMRWLIPRLGRFRRDHPMIDLRVSTTYKAVDFAREDFDAAVRYGTGEWPDLHVTKVFEEELIPVCSPKLLTAATPCREPDDLRAFTLIHSGTCVDNWRLWLTAVGATEVDPRAGMTFDTCLLSFEAACEGLGFAIANRGYVARDLESGRLVAPIDFELPNNHGWHFVCPKGHEDNPKISAVRAWLTEPLC